MSADPRFAYRENAARMDSPVGREVLLYEQAIQDLSGALAAIESHDIETRSNKISHALLVIGQLQACLDLDRGGDVARNLDRFYSLLQKRLFEAQVTSSATILRQQMELLLSIRAAWVEVESAETQATKASPGSPSVAAQVKQDEASASRWRA